MVNLAGVPIAERIKLMTVMLVNGMTTEVDYVLDRTGGSGLRELAVHSLRMLAESRQELNDIKKGLSNE